MTQEEEHQRVPEGIPGSPFTETESEAIRSRFLEILKAPGKRKTIPAGEIPVEWLWEEFRRDNEPQYRFQVAEALFRTAENTPETIRQLNSVLDDKTGYELRYLIALAGKFRSPECLDSLLRVLKNETNALAALDAIRRIKDPRAESALQECLSSQKPEIRLKAQRTRRWIEEKTGSSLHPPRSIRPLSTEFAAFLNERSESFAKLYPALELFLTGENSEQKVMTLPETPKPKGIARFFRLIFGENDFSGHRAVGCLNLYYTSRLLQALPALTANRIKETDAGYLIAALKEFEVDLPFGWRISLPPEDLGELIDEHQWKKRAEEDTNFLLILEGDFEAYLHFEFISTDTHFLSRLREQINKLTAEFEKDNI